MTIVLCEFLYFSFSPSVLSKPDNEQIETWRRGVVIPDGDRTPIHAVSTQLV